MCSCSPAQDELTPQNRSAAYKMYKLNQSQLYSHFWMLLRGFDTENAPKGQVHNYTPFT